MCFVDFDTIGAATDALARLDGISGDIIISLSAVRSTGTIQTRKIEVSAEKPASPKRKTSLPLSSEHAKKARLEDGNDLATAIWNLEYLSESVRLIFRTGVERLHAFQSLVAPGSDMEQRVKTMLLVIKEMVDLQSEEAEWTKNNAASAIFMGMHWGIQIEHAKGQALQTEGEKQVEQSREKGGLMSSTESEQQPTASKQHEVRRPYDHPHSALNDVGAILPSY